MRPIDFPESNVTAMDDADCLPISLYVGECASGHRYINTVWQPSREDIEAIVAGRPIVVSVSGEYLPSLCLFTYNEAGEPNL